MSDVLSIGRLNVLQNKLSADTTANDNFDLVLVAVSWEARAGASIKKFGGTNCPTTFLRFESASNETNKKKDSTQRKLKKICPNGKQLKLKKSIEFEENCQKIEQHIKDIYLAKKRPLRVLIDITCIPKMYVSFLCGLGFKRNYFASMDCLYASGSYDISAMAAVGPVSIISEGEWYSQQIPYFEGEDYFSGKRDLVVILGGEFGHSLPFLERYEPRRLGLVFIKDGFNLETLSGSELAAYNDLVSGPGLVREDFDIHDVVGVLSFIHKFCSESEGRAVVGLAIGCKSQSLGLSLAALDIENLEIVCRIPTSYRELDVSPTGDVFKFEILDRFEPTAYFPVKAEDVAGC